MDAPTHLHPDALAFANQESQPDATADYNRHARHTYAQAWRGRGLGVPTISATSLAIFADWAFRWGPSVAVVSAGYESVPMISWGTYKDLPPLVNVKDVDTGGLAYPGGTPHDYWLVYNECEHQDQCNTSPEEAADYLHDEIIRTITKWGGDPNAQLIIGGVNANECGIVWLEQLVQSYEAKYGPLPHAGWHFHIYPEIAPVGWPDNCEGLWQYKDYLFDTPTPVPPQSPLWSLWQEHATNMLTFVWRYGEADDELWLTEMGCTRHRQQDGGPACDAPGLMYLYTSEMTEWLNNEGRWVNRYAWYTDWDDGYWEQTKLYDMTRTPTPGAPTTPIPVLS